jgi:hypothetical protein
LGFGFWAPFEELNYAGVDAAMISADVDQVISTSWGLCEQAIETGQPGLQEAENELFEEAAAQGQTVFSAAGDNGSDDCNTFETSTPVAGQNPISEDDPSSQPYVVSVGGTTIDDASSAPPLEHVWNDGATEGGGGGGISQSWRCRVGRRRRPCRGSTGKGQRSRLAGWSPMSRLKPTSSPVRSRSSRRRSAAGARSAGPRRRRRSGRRCSRWSNASSTCTSNPATAHGIGFASPLLYVAASK